MATSFSPNISMVILGQKLVEEMTDDELTAVIAHELGHVKFNHIPKNIIMNLALAGGSVALASYIAYKMHHVGPRALLETIGIFSATGVAIGAISVYVTYRHECQADDEAIRAVGAQPFVDSMEAIKKHIITELGIFEKEHTYCVSQLKKLEDLNPEKAADIKDTLDAIKNRVYSRVQSHLDTDGDHPALNKRIEHGKEQLAAQ
jgi:Zn-dependent protease with chaperone function